MGLPALTSETRKRLADADGLRAAILRAEFDLPTEPFSTLTKTRNDLLWQQLFDPAAAQSLSKQLPQFSQRAFNQGTIMELLLNNLLQSPKSLRWDKALKQLVAKSANARRTDPNELRLAILRQALDDISIEPATHTAEMPATLEVSSVAREFSNLELEDFANTVLAAVKNTEEGWFGDSKVFISQVWKTLKSQQPDYPFTLDEFKQKLLAANRKEWISLSRADLGYSLDSEDVAASEIVYLQSQFHFIRID